MAKVKRGSRVKKGLKFFIYGQEGTWKSSMAAELLKMKNEEGNPMRVAYIDCETGSIDNYLDDLEDEGVDLDNLLLIYTSSYAEVEEWANKIMNNEEIEIEDDEGNFEEVLDAEGNPFKADAIVIDGITVITDNVKYAAIGVSEKRAKLKAQAQDKTATEQFVASSTAGLEFKDFDKINMKGKNLLRNLVTGTDKYVVVTAREKQKKEMQKVDGQMTMVNLGVIPDTWKGAEYEFFTVLRNFEDEDGSIKSKVVRKDRTKVFGQNDIIEEPSLMMWQSVIDGNKGKKSSASYSMGKNEESITKDEDSLDEGLNANVANMGVEGLKKEIKEKIGKLDAKGKKEAQENIKKFGLEVDFNKINSADDLKKFLKVIG